MRRSSQEGSNYRSQESLIRYTFEKKSFIETCLAQLMEHVCFMPDFSYYPMMALEEGE
jgi:hypothetical protein